MPTDLHWLEPRRVAELLRAGTDSFRMADGKDVFIERFGGACLISSTHPEAALAVIPSLHEHLAACGLPPASAIYARTLVREPGRGDVPRLVEGMADDVIATEANLRYHIDFSAGYSCGLFLDQRDNRARVRAARPQRLLNCFAFTCSFSLCAADAGAETTSLDLAKSALQRGRANFLLNGIATPGHRFIADDVFDVLPRLARRGDLFDTIILDPPTFSRGNRGRIFRAEDDLTALLELALRCAASGASLLLSTNCSRIGPSRLASLVRATAGGTVAITPPQPDFPSSGASSVWLTT